MEDVERRALSNLRFDWAPTPRAVWEPPRAHVEGLNEDVLKAVMAAFTDADLDATSNPLGVVITGQQGAGKTHMLTAVRAEVQRVGGYFFLVSLLHGRNFWQNIVHALRAGLYERGPDGANQLTTLLHRLADRLVLPDAARYEVIGKNPVTRETLDRLVVALRDADPVHGWKSRHTARAVVLLAAEDPMVQEIGEAYLTSGSEAVAGERVQWGISPDSKPPHEIVRELSALLAMTGPSLLAVDQIDTLVAQSGRSTRTVQVDMGRDELFDQIGTGLMEVRESVLRSLTVVACQFPAWEAIRTRAHGAAADRFRPEYRLKGVATPETAEKLVATRFAPRFADCGFTPPYPTWPVRREAFEGASQFTPRLLFKRIDEHIRSCLDNDVVSELSDLAEQVPTPKPEAPAEPAVAVSSPLDARFAELLRNVDLRTALDKDTEDTRMTTLLGAALQAYVYELGERGQHYVVDANWGGEPRVARQAPVCVGRRVR
ncbi:hypothetical protein [Saccharothrix obliqua]|uniref:hypothetical protein n=1 Tax=Saccharothrix obliqua TaxID=2861747 RepID=UPI0021517A7D|nr:hypothetical protein [Saccharothrix obliqua]